MMYLRWLLITVYAVATTLLAVTLTPVVVLFFADHRTGRLAWPFRWMETPDVLLPGDPNHVGTPSTEADLSGWYWTSMRWLWRNPAYRATDFAKLVPPGEVLRHSSRWQEWWISLASKTSGDMAIIETPFRGGYFYAELWSYPHRVFEFYWLWKWPGIDRCIRLRCGWKLKPWYQGKPYVPTDVDGMHVISFNPWMRCN